MKTSILILTVIFFSLRAKGQQNIFKNKPWEDYKKKELLSQKLKQITPSVDNNNFLQRPAAGNKSVLIIPLTGTFIKNTGKGSDLYVVNTFKMPCIVPDKTFTSNMPIAGYDKSINSRLLSEGK